MRLLTSSQPSADKSSKSSEKSAVSVSAKADTGNRDRSTKANGKKKGAEPEPAAPVAPAVDYTRPTTSTELLAELQRRVIKLEELQYRKLTAGEFALAVELTTGQSLEWHQKRGTVVEKCDCDKLSCKGWRMVPIEHHRTAAKTPPADTSPVDVAKLTDVQALEDDEDMYAREQHTRAVADQGKEHRLKVFKRMFRDGLLKEGKGGSTLIPKDGPITWTHEEQMAFAEGFEMTDLLELEGKPREMQRKLITSLREIGYHVLSAPEK